MKIILFLKQIIHHCRILKWRLLPKKNEIDFFGESIISISARWNSELNPFFSYVAIFDVLRQRNFSGTFLEFGGGYSTVLGQILLKNTEYTSVDIYPEKYYRILNSKKILLTF